MAKIRPPDKNCWSLSISKNLACHDARSREFAGDDRARNAPLSIVVCLVLASFPARPSRGRQTGRSARLPIGASEEVYQLSICIQKHGVGFSKNIDNAAN